MLSLDMPASPEMESIFLIGGTGSVPSAMDATAGVPPKENLAHCGGDPVTAVGFDRGAATGEGGGEEKGAESGKQNCSHGVPLVLVIRKRRQSWASVAFRLCEIKSQEQNFMASSRRLTLPRSFTGISSTKKIRFGTCHPLRFSRQNSSRSGSRTPLITTTQAATSSLRRMDSGPNTTAPR